MITTFFSKSRPLNYILVFSMLVMSFLYTEFSSTNNSQNNLNFVLKAIILLLMMLTVFLTEVTIKKNNLSKNSTYCIFFFVLFFILFHSVENSFELITSNVLIIFAIQKVISIEKLQLSKEKIFDASLLIFTASLFHFWAILFIILVFVAITAQVSRDYRNWTIPFVGLITVFIMFVFIGFLFDKSILFNVKQKIIASFDFHYFKNKYQNLALAIYASMVSLFFFSQLLSYSKKPSLQHFTYRIIIISFLIGIAIYIFSDKKGNNVLIYTFMPLAVMATSFIKDVELKWMKEISLIIIVLLCLTSFFLQS